MFENKPDLPRVRQMRSAVDDFWIDIKLGKCPESEKGDIENKDDDEKLFGHLMTYAELDANEKDVKCAKVVYRDLITPYAVDGSISCRGFKVIKTEPRKTYDMKAMKEDGIDIEKYAKVSGEGSYRIQTPK